MLLNKIPCLDKGYAALIDSSNDSTRINEVRDEFFSSFDTPALFDNGTMTLVLKCPLFVQLNLSKFNFNIVTAPTKEPETYIPNPGEIGSTDVETNRIIADDIERTSAALLINPKAYQADGCDKFMSQILSPISIYTTLIVHGSYNEWKRYCQQGNLPAPIEAYRIAIEQIRTAEWK